MGLIRRLGPCEGCGLDDCYEYMHCGNRECRCGCANTAAVEQASMLPVRDIGGEG